MDARRGMLPKMKMFARRGRMKRKILPARRGMSKPEIVKAGHGMLPKMRVIEAEDLFARRGMLNSMNRATSKKERNQEEEREEEFSFSIYTNSRSTANAARCYYTYHIRYMRKCRLKEVQKKKNFLSKKNSFFFE